MEFCNMDTDLVFVYNRTMEDVEHVIELTRKYQEGTITDEEKRIWSNGMKGAINASDLNRIESNISVVASILCAKIKDSRKDWTSYDIPYTEDYDRIINNTQIIRDALPYAPGVPTVPGRPLNTFEKWNDIERITHDMKELYIRIINSRYQCGDEIIAGEEVGML